ncbi:MAG TPA: family 10 glycosylhydrolase, partial [Longimicrobiales bacterium]|nr:family 10 glycosylhydrolase [Longimicrobiales bacterium]
MRTTMNRAESIRAMVDRAAAAGVNTLLLQVRGRGDAYYRSRWEPRAESVVGTPGFDPLALAIEEAHARGMAVHAWVNTHLVHGLGEPPASPDHLVNAHPDWVAVPRALGRELVGVPPDDPRYRNTLLAWARDNRERVEGLYSSPSHPAVQERVYSVWMDLVERYDLDGLHFDYVRYPSSEFDYSAGALERFREWVAPRLSAERAGELDRARATDPYAYPEGLPDAWAEFRRDQVTGLVERVYHGVKARRPELLVSAAVFPDASDAYRSRYQDWEGWLTDG